MRKRFFVGIGSILLTAIAAILNGSLMLRTETVIAVPEAGQEIPLEKLSYKARFEAKVSSVRLDFRSSEGAGPVTGDWTFTGSNTDGQIHRVEMQLRLRNDSGQQIGFFSARHVLAPGARDQKFSVPMKVPADVWKAARSVRIVADWIT